MRNQTGSGGAGKWGSGNTILLTPTLPHSPTPSRFWREFIAGVFSALAVIALLIGLLLLLPGCALIPTSRTSTQDARAAGNATSQHETTLRRATEGVLPPNINITIGKGGIVTMPAPAVAVPPSAFKETLDVSDDAGLTSESSFSWAKFSKVAIPWGIRLLLAALGILALIWVIKYARRTSPAIDAVIGTADAAIAARINKHRETAMGSTDPAVIAESSARIASLQEDRVNLHKSKPKS